MGPSASSGAVSGRPLLRLGTRPLRFSAVCASLRPPRSVSSASAGLPATGPVATGVEPALPLPAHGAARPQVPTPSRPSNTCVVCSFQVKELFPQQMLQAAAHLQPVPSLPDSPGWKGTPSVKVVCTSCPHSWHNKPCARHCPLHLAPLAPRHGQKFSSTFTTQMCARAPVNASLPRFRFGAWPSLSGHPTPRPGAPESNRPTRIQSPLQPLP